MSNFEKTQTVLPENVEKESDKHPDFRGQLTLFHTTYKAAAWLKNNKKNEPCIGLSLSSADNNIDDINVTLWLKGNRTSAAEPHFRLRETMMEEPLVFSAWVEHAGDLCSLRIEVTRSGDQLSDAAKQTRSRILAFVQEADGNFPSSPDLNAEPDDIPF